MRFVDSGFRTLTRAVKRSVRFTWLLGSLAWVFCAWAQAQPTLGGVYKDQLVLGAGSSVPLPPGTWQLMHVAQLPRKGYAWESMVLKNTSAHANIPFMVVRASNLGVRWGATSCSTDAKNTHSFLVSEHGTLANQLVNKCSRVFQLSHFGNWLRDTASKSEWWQSLLEGFKDLGSAQDKSMLLAELRLQVFNSRGLDVSLFIVPPDHSGTGKFRDDARAGKGGPNQELLGDWLSLLIESMEQSFTNKKPANMVALQFLGSSQILAQASTKAAAPAVLPPADRSVPGAGGPLPAPVGSGPIAQSQRAGQPESKRIDPERAAIEEERKQLLLQMEKMRELVAQLQQANVAALAQATSQAKAADTKTAPVTVMAQRKALVIGNDAYTDVPKLANAAADAHSMAAALESVGFKVFKHLNIDEKKFKQALREFRMQVQGGDEVLVFYAGHGVQLGNANYLLPIDIKGDHEDQVKDEAIQLQRILDDLQERKTKFALAVIDACRDNPFKGSGRAIGGRGLAPTTAATGQMIIFSAGVGQQALDRLSNDDQDPNGLFTRIFIKEMKAPGQRIDNLAREVRKKVVEAAKAVGHEQVPAIYDQVVGDFYFSQ